MSGFPLVIAGPLVRCITKSSASVWLVLTKPAKVTLTLFKNGDGSDEITKGTAATVAVADRIHIVTVSSPAGFHANGFTEGRRYFYSLEINTLDGVDVDLFDQGVLSVDGDEQQNRHRLLYPGQQLPSFFVPAKSLEKLKLAHGSCRKPHGEGIDGFMYLDERLQADIDDIHILCLTGDQIYADDVDAVVLAAIHQLTAELSDHGDPEHDRLKETYKNLLDYGNRQSLVKHRAGFTSGKADGHLVTFLEYVIMYLLVWSDTLWFAIPASENLARFREALPSVQRVLANTSTYMLFDDHEVTDDWNLSQDWVNKVNGSALGAQIITNAMCAYALFQHWGNVPDKFLDSSEEHLLLDVIEYWAGEQVSSHISLAAQVAKSAPTLKLSVQQLFNWSYVIEYTGFRIVALDTRTHRIFAAGKTGLMSMESMDEVLALDSSNPKPLIVLSPAPVIGFRAIEQLQNIAKTIAAWFGKEVGHKVDHEAWSFHKAAYNYLLDSLAAHHRVLVLSGDVHYAFGASLRKNNDRIVNFVASSLKNQRIGSTFAHALSIIGGGQLENIKSDQISTDAVPNDIEALQETLDESWEQILLVDEESAGTKENALLEHPESEVSLEAVSDFERGRRWARVIGSSNFGLVGFGKGRVTQLILWSDDDGKSVQQTEHWATFDLTKIS